MAGLHILFVIQASAVKKDENCNLVGCYTASSGNSLTIGFPETSVRNYHYSLRNNPEKLSSRADILFVIMVREKEQWLTSMGQLTQDFASITISVKTTQ